ncbi:MAG: phage tail family protein [Nitrosopumilus sp.]
MAAPLLLDYQMWFNELLIGVNTNYDFVQVSGLFGLNIRDGDKPFPRQHGSIPGEHYKGTIDPVLTIDCVDIPSSLWTTVRRFDEAFTTSEQTDLQGELHFKLPGLPQLFLRARTRRKQTSIDGLNVGLIPRTVSLKAVDPRYYSYIQYSENFPEFNFTGGSLDWDIDWDVDFTGGGSTGEFVITNAGNGNAYPIIKFHFGISGTITAVQLTNVTTGQLLDIDRAILTGQILTADMDKIVRGESGNIIDIAGASAYDDWQLPRAADPFFFQPGTNRLRFELTGSSPNASCTVIWRDTYI